MGGAPASRFEFLDRFMTMSSPFVIKIEDISSHRTGFLDLVLHKGPRWHMTGLLDYSLYTKPSSLWLPLSSKSGHAPSVHMAWPVGQLVRLKRRFYCPSEASKAINDFKHRYKVANGHDFFEFNSSSSSSPIRRNNQGSFVVLPCREEWNKAGIPRMLKKTFDEWEPLLRPLGGKTSVAPMLSWRNSAQNLIQTVHRYNKAMHKDADRYNIFIGRR